MTFGRSGFVALIVLCTAQFMLVLDISIVLVALPSIQPDLGFSTESLQLVITVYALTFGSLLLLGGRAADFLGRRRILAAGLVLFTVASLVCGLAQSPAVLILGRAAQGVGGALVSPAALSLLTTIFREGSQRNKALGVWGAVAAGGAAAGLVFGGVLTELLSWRWVFLVNVPIGVALIAALPRTLPESRVPGSGRIDIAGAALVTLALAAIVYGLTRGEQEGFAEGITIALLAGGALLFALFAYVETRVANPLVPFRIFRLRTLTGANVATLFAGAVIAGESFFLTLYIQEVLGFSPIETGLVFLPLAVAVAATSIVASGIVGRIGARRLMFLGGLSLAGGTALLSQVSPGGSYLGDVLPGMMLIAVGLGLTFTVGAVAATAGVEAREQGLASGLFNTSQQVGTAVGLAVLATVASAAGATASDPAVALTDGFRVGFLVATAFGVVAAFAALLLIRERDCEQELARRSTEGTPDALRVPLATSLAHDIERNPR